MPVEMSSRHMFKKNVKLAIKRSKISKDVVESKDRRKKGFSGNKKAQSSAKENVDVFPNRKRKRIYAEPDMSEKGISRIHTKDPPKERRSQLKDDFVKVKRTVRLKGGSTPQESESIEDKKRKNSRSSRKVKETVWSANKYGGKLKTKGKAADRSRMEKVDGSGSDLNKRLAKNKTDLSKHLNQSQMKDSKVFLEKYAKKMNKDNKSLDEDSAVTDDKIKKWKRVIRIDPRDITNKRLDDGMVINESSKEKKEDLEKEVKMSKNAQFRAIEPSPSILSFVEDNLLGRRRLIELRRSGYNIELSAPLDNIPFSTSSERERIEENVFRNKLTFFAAAKISSSFPPPDLPEIAFAGRSNVGKSSLLNALTRQWGVVRTSDKPGLTQTINFFNLGSKLCLVDLPGYGFAYAKEEVKDSWEELVKEYVSTRVGLKQVCLLIDTKWGMKPRDHELIDLMERSQTKCQIVLTKTDMVFPIDVARRAMQIEESLKANTSVVQPLMMVSSKSGAGIRSLRTVLAKIARFAKL